MAAALFEFDITLRLWRYPNSHTTPARSYAMENKAPGSKANAVATGLLTPLSYDDLDIKSSGNANASTYQMW
jgi:hypothetical protein